MSARRKGEWSEERGARGEGEGEGLIQAIPSLLSALGL